MLGCQDYLDPVSDIAGLFLPPSEGSNDHHVPSFYTFLLVFCQKSLSLLEIGLRELHISRGSRILESPSDLDQTQNRALEPSLHAAKLMESPRISLKTISAEIILPGEIYFLFGYLA